MHRKLSVPRCLLMLGQSIKLCDIFLMRSRISTLLRMGILKEMDAPHGEQSHQSHIKSLGLPVLLLSHCTCLGTVQSDMWLLAELAAAVHGGTSRVSCLLHAQWGVQHVLEAID